MCFEVVEDIAEVFVKFLYAIDIGVVVGVTLAVAVVVRIDGEVWPRSGVVCKEFFVVLNGGTDEVYHLRREQASAFRLVEIFLVRAHFLGVEVAVSVHVVLNPVVRSHIVDVITAVEVVKALIGGQILTIIAEIPLAYATRAVTRALQYFRKSDFVAQNSVHVVEELIGIEEVRGRPRIGLNIAGEHDVVEISS